MQNNLFIPSKIRVGFQQRHDTFTGKLAYIIYYDEKGKIRKESSWSGWCDSKLEVLELDNVPQSGYILNKGVQRSRDWGSGRSVIRVYDPRDFEFEIDVDNLIGVLMHSDVSKRDIVEQCVFAWIGGNLILLPVNSEAYTESVIYTAKQSNKVSAKDLIKGAQYRRKKNDDILTYIGHFNTWEWKTNYADGEGRYSNRGKKHVSRGKKQHVFYEKSKYSTGFITPSISTLAEMISAEPVDNYAFLVDDFFHTSQSQPVVGVRIDFNLMVEKFAGKELSRHNYPTLCKLTSDNVLSILYANNYFYRDEPYTKINYSMIPLNIDYDDGSIKFTNSLFTSGTRTYDRHTSCSYDSTSDIQYAMMQIIIAEGYPQILTIEQYIHVMSKLGYGACMLVLATGNEVEYSI